MQILIIFHGIDDGDHHDQIETILSEVGHHVGGCYKPETDSRIRNNPSTHKSCAITESRNTKQDAHQLFSCDLSCDHRIENHHKCRGDHADCIEDGIQATAVTIIQIDIRRSKTTLGKLISNLLNHKCSSNPHQLIIAPYHRYNVFQTDAAVVTAVFSH